MRAKVKAANNISHDIKTKRLKSRFSTGKNRSGERNNAKVNRVKDGRTFWREIVIMHETLDNTKNNDTR